ncbi:ChaN family lipoprotein [Rhodovulum sp. YNF3179]|uniref:ChaN family lipoprotein n=1 Tax=Rhodovulum sp. YNF3179 TaxID=3425127 RepID=UPI003D33A206
MMTRLAIFVLTVCLAPAIAGAMRMEPAALDTLPRADVVILGEVHDNPRHHENQARALAALEPAAVVFEMLRPEQAAQVTPGNRADPVALAEALGWAESGWPDFAMYHPLFTAAPGAAIVGGALPRATVRRAMGEDPAAIFGEGAAEYGLAAPLPEAEQTAREADQMAAHCDALPPEMLPGMVAAQRLRDAALARAVVEAAEMHGTPVALVTGNGHAHLRRGVPAALRRARPGLEVLSIGQLESDPLPPAPYDRWLVTAPADRADPCAAFRGD